LGAGVALVEYHSTAERTYAWVVRRETINVVTIDAGREELARKARRYRDTIRSRSPDASGLGSSLYDQLVRPLGLKDGEALVIVPHGMLHQVPFQALRGPKGYLIEERPISYMASGSTLAHLLRRARGERQQMLALGNPDLGSPRLALVGAEREVEQIKAFFPSAEIYIKQEATKERLLARAPESQLVHVAAHAQVDEIDPLYSVIRLARSPKMPGDLEAHEVYDMNLSRTGMVVLSACDSGLARVSRGDELWGFTRSFFAAGTRTLVVSLWPVEDAATAQLMQGFYDDLRRSAAHEALRAAQLSLLQDTRTAHPFFWAAFSVVGDWQ
jgi:CHAT domain-containing protein